MKKRIELVLLLFSILFFKYSIAQDVTVTPSNNGMYWEISNGLLGIAIPSEKGFTNNIEQPLAPIQYFIYADGTRSDNTPNTLKNIYPGMGGKGPQRMTINWLIRSGNECKVEIRYSFNKPKYVYDKKTYPGGEAGPGYYKSTIHIQKGSKSIMVEDESDYEIGYDIDVQIGLQPDQARYRGWNAGNTALGYEKPGQPYRNEIERGYPMDATVDFNEGMTTWVSHWNLAGGEINTGRYWMFYKKDAPTNSNLLGLFHGRPEKMIGANAYGVIVRKKLDNSSRQQSAELTVWLDRRGPDNTWYPKKRFEWGIFISTKKDLLSPEKIQPINLELNKLSGLALKIDQFAERPLKISPNFFQGAIFCSSEKIQDLIKRVRTDAGFYNSIKSSEPYYAPLLDAWRNQDSANSLVRSLLDYYAQLRQNYKTGPGVYRDDLRYWKGAFNFKLKATLIAGLFADNNIAIKSDEKNLLVSLVKVMGRILWDNSNVPFFVGSGMNFGTANMPLQYVNGRNFFALIFAKDPEFSTRAKNVLGDVKNNITDAIYKNGSAIGTPHYSQASIEPFLFTILQLKQAGVADMFKDNQRLKMFTEFYQSLLTPPSPRFLNYHKLISFGDGSEESSVTFALLASGYEKINPKLSNLLYYFYENGAPRMSLFGPTFLSADLTKKHVATPAFSSSNYFGYMSNLRLGANTRNETSMWVLNGDSMYDHRNDDAGEVAIYAFKAPLSLSRSSFYYPHATDSRIKSTVVPLSMFPEWDKDNQPIDIRSLKPRTWEKSTQVEFAKCESFTSSLSQMSTGKSEWFRKLILISGESGQPVIVMVDSVSNKEENIWSMLFMSDGPVKTPAGAITPEKRVHNNNTLKQLPAGTPARELRAGLNRFEFTGQNWNKKYHESGGIDWDVYTYTSTRSSFSLAQWTTTWQNTAEVTEFRATNGKPYEEGQQILRWKSRTPFFTIILPYQKGKPYKNDLIEIREGVFALADDDDSLIISKNGYWRKYDKNIIAAAWSKETFDYAKTSISGGPAEVEIKKGVLVIRVHGNSGKRTIRVPVKNIPVSSKYKNVKIKKISDRSEITIDYKNDKIDLLPNEKGYSEFTLKLIEPAE